MLVLLLAAAPLGAPAAAGEGWQPSWVRLIGPDSALSQFEAALVPAAANDLWIGGSTRRPEESERRAALWIVSGRLEPAREVELAPDDSLTTVRSMAELPGGEILLLGSGVATDTLLLLSAGGEVLWRRDLVAEGPPARLHKLVAASDGVLAIGQAVDSGVVLRIDAAGEVAMRKELAPGEQTVLMDAIPLGDGGFYLIANHGRYEPGFVGPCVVWVGRFDARGRQLAATEFLGRHGSAVAVGDDGLRIVYDHSASREEQRIGLRELAPDLSQRRLLELVTTGDALWPEVFEVLRADGDGWLASGARESRPWIARYDGEGRRQRLFWGREFEIAPRYLVVPGRGELFVVSTGIEIGRRDGLTVKSKKIRVIALALEERPKAASLSP